MSEEVPFKPVGGRVLVRALPYKPSKSIEIFTVDKADENEGIVVALSECQYGRKRDHEKGWEHNGITFPHEIQIGQRVFFAGSYSDSDTMTFNGVKHRCLDSWEILGILDAPQPDGFENPLTGEKTPDIHPFLIH